MTTQTHTLLRNLNDSMDPTIAEPDHWLISLAKTDPLDTQPRMIQALRLYFIGAVKHLSEDGTMADIRALVAALETAEAIAKERQP